MAYAQGQTPLPPPPPGGGNRTNQHIVGGKTANLGYSAGANLKSARTLYQSGQQGSFFRNQSAVKPQFNYNPTNNSQPLPNEAQATGNQLRANTLGQVRPANAPAGMGYQSIPQGPVRQHTLPFGANAAPHGKEALAAHLTYTPLPPPPAAPVTTTPAGTTTAPAGKDPVADPNVDHNTKAKELASARAKYDPKRHVGRIKLNTSPPMWAPLIKHAKHPKGVIDPSWQRWMRFAQVHSVQSGVGSARPQSTVTGNPVGPKPAAPVAPGGAAPGAAPPAGTPPPGPASYGPGNPPPYGQGGWLRGSVIGGRKILGGVMKNGRYVPIVNNPNVPGGRMMHPWWR